MRNGTKLAMVASALVVVFLGMQIIDVKAQVEDAVSVTPARIDFGVTIPEVTYEAACDPDTDPSGASGRCLAIHLSESFLKQKQFSDVEYTVYCEDKPLGDLARGDANIAPFILLKDSDPADDNDALDNPNGVGQGCGKIVYSTDPAAVNPVQWARGVLDMGFDLHDLWDMTFFAPLCSNSYNALTDPIKPEDQVGGGLIDAGLCHRVEGDEYVDLGSNVKFEVTGFSTPTPTPRTVTPTGLGFTSTPRTVTPTGLGFTSTPIGFPQTGGSGPASSDGLWLIVAGGIITALAVAGYAAYGRRSAGRD